MSFQKSFKPVVVFNIKTLRFDIFKVWTVIFEHQFLFSKLIPFFRFHIIPLHFLSSGSNVICKKKSFYFFIFLQNLMTQDLYGTWEKKIAEKNQFRSLQQTFVLIWQKNKTIMFKSVPKSESCHNEVWKYTE